MEALFLSHLPKPPPYMEGLVFAHKLEKRFQNQKTKADFDAADKLSKVRNPWKLYHGFTAEEKIYHFHIYSRE